MTKTMRLAELVEDFSLYPRITVDGQHVNQIKMAIESGDVMPPIVVWDGKNIIIDGVHRRRAMLSIDPDAVAECKMVKYQDKAAAFIDAIRLNATHGRMLSPADKTRCVLFARKLGIDDEQTAKALKVTIKIVKSSVETRCAKVSVKYGHVPVVLKPAVLHMAGRVLTPKQVEVNESLGGNKTGFYAQQLLMLIESDMIDTDNEKDMMKLASLRDALVSWKPLQSWTATGVNA